MLLAFDTATRQISLAIFDGQRVLAEHTWRSAATHSVELAPQAALMLRRAELTPAALSGVAVAQGPGAYTSLRIGLGFAKGLALACNLPLIGVDTWAIILRALTAEAGLLAAPRALALLEAGRRRVLAAAFTWDGRGWQAEGAARVIEWAALPAEVSGPTLVCGEWEAAPAEAVRALRAGGRATLVSAAGALRRAGYLAEIGWERLQTGQTDDPLRLAPHYATQPEGLAA